MAQLTLTDCMGISPELNDQIKQVLLNTQADGEDTATLFFPDLYQRELYKQRQIISAWLTAQGFTYVTTEQPLFSNNSWALPPSRLAVENIPDKLMASPKKSLGFYNDAEDSYQNYRIFVKMS